MDIRYKLTILIYSIAFTISSFKCDHIYYPKYNIYDENEIEYGEYEKGKVYIVKQEDINNIGDINDNDILVIYDESQSDIKVKSSYKINNKEYRNEILCIINNYKNTNDINWYRSIESMRLEWYVHNILYKLNIERNRTEDVDFHIDEEKIYNKKIYSKILKL